LNVFYSLPSLRDVVVGLIKRVIWSSHHPQVRLHRSPTLRQRQSPNLHLNRSQPPSPNLRQSPSLHLNRSHLPSQNLNPHRVQQIVPVIT
jgi:hypothetical protein